MLKENTELETIELTDISLVSESLNPECREMKWIVKLMSNITSSDFKKVVFYLQIHVAANVQALPLASLDTVFSARKFDDLRHVNFIISWQHSELFREVLDILVKGLPRLHSRGLVSLSCDAD